MKTLTITTVYLLISISRTSAATYTLDTLLEIGFDHSRELKIVKEEMDKAEAQIREYYGKAFPKLDFNANYQYSWKQYDPLQMGETGDMPSAAELIEPANPTTADNILADILDGITGMFTDIDFTKDHTATVGLSLTQPLFSQGKVLTGLKIARLYNRSLLCKWQDTQMKVKANITRLFYSALLAEKNTEIQNHAITLAQEAHRLAVIRFQSGKGTELDTLNTRLNLESSRISYQESKKGQRTALDALVKATGIPDRVEDVELTGDFPDDEYSIDLDEAIKYVRSENKQVIQLNVAREIQYNLVKIAKSDYLPLVYCGGSISKITQFNREDDIVWQDDQKVYIGLTYNLFNGLQRAQRIKQAKSDARSIEQSRELAIEGMELMTRNAWESLETSRKKLAQAKSLLALAEKAYTVSKKAFELGGVTLLDFQDSEQKFNGARIAHNAALFEFYNAVIDLRLLMGDFLYEPEEDKEWEK